MELDAKKQKLIDDFMNMSKGRTSDEILPLILAVSQKAKQMGISFTKEETLHFVNELKTNLTEAEKAKVDMLMRIMM
ncbi:MAG: hypothetical protein ACI4AQ_05705 [Lachnospiraceae bacterium]